MAEIMTPEELKAYVNSMPDDEILAVTFENEEDGRGRDDRER